MERGCNFYMKIKLKSEISNDKKIFKTKMFFSVMTKNSNWEILTKNLDKLGLRMKNLNFGGGGVEGEFIEKLDF